MYSRLLDTATTSSEVSVSTTMTGISIDSMHNIDKAKKYEMRVLISAFSIKSLIREVYSIAQGSVEIGERTVTSFVSSCGHKRLEMKSVPESSLETDSTSSSVLSLSS